MKVRLFALQREQVGWSEREVEVTDGSTVASLITALGRDYPAIATAARHLVAAVNAEYVEPGHILRSGDEVALIPPVSGGLSCPRCGQGGPQAVDLPQGAGVCSGGNGLCPCAWPPG